MLAPAGTPTNCAARWSSADTAERVLPYEGLVARLGTERGVPRGLAVASTQVLDADAVLARIIPAGRSSR